MIETNPKNAISMNQNSLIPNPFTVKREKFSKIINATVKTMADTVAPIRQINERGWPFGDSQGTSLPRQDPTVVVQKHTGLFGLQVRDQFNDVRHGVRRGRQLQGATPD